VLHPSQFQSDEAWIAFRLNDAPVHTEEEGSFNVVALMDASSCFIFGAEFVAVEKAEPSQVEVRRLFKAAKKQTQALPNTLFLPSGQFETFLAVEAERLGIAVVRVEDRELLSFIGEARAGFSERFSRKGEQ
jgi:predicted short-subunit dehydrogenase-like oxidoreductase (DUF2520 family)